MPVTNRPPDAMAKTEANKQAGGFLKDARLKIKADQFSFSLLLSKLLGVPIDATSISHWEHGRNTVPGPVLFAAVGLSGLSLRVDRASLKALWAAIASDLESELVASRWPTKAPDSPQGETTDT